MTTQEEIPVEVLEWLEIARSDGSFNMMARNDVIRLIMEQDESEGLDAANWLINNKNRYMEALTEMGKRRGSDS